MRDLAVEIKDLIVKKKIKVETEVGSTIIWVYDPKVPHVLSSIDDLAVYRIGQKDGRTIIRTDHPERLVDSANEMDYAIFVIDKFLRGKEFVYEAENGHYIRLQ